MKANLLLRIASIVAAARLKLERGFQAASWSGTLTRLESRAIRPFVSRSGLKPALRCAFARASTNRRWFWLIGSGVAVLLAACSTTGERARTEYRAPEYRAPVLTPQIQVWLAQPVPPLRDGFQQGKAVVRSLKGRGDYAGADGQWKPLKVGERLSPGSFLRTYTGSEAGLFLGQNGPVVRVFGETFLHLQKLNFKTNGADVVVETLLRLPKGQIQGVVKKLADGSVYKVETPETVCTVRGTEFVLNANGLLMVNSGSVECLANNKLVSIRTGQVFDREKDVVRPMTPDETKLFHMIFDDPITIIEPRWIWIRPLWERVY